MERKRKGEEKMKLIKVVKQIGNSAGNIFSKEECKTMGIEIGDFIDLTDVRVIKQTKEVNKEDGNI